jgi:hypothetical protein
VPLEVTEEQVLWFRARRGFLAGDGAPDVSAAARTILGAQAQQLPPALLALSMRTRGRPTAAEVMRQLTTPPRTLVWTWGQRGTLHLYCPATDWARIVAARPVLAHGQRGGPMPTASMLERALEFLHSSDEPVTRSDLVGVAPKRYVAAVAEVAAGANMDPERLAAARLLWRLALDGHVSLAGTIGNERTYAARAAWFPALSWPAVSETGDEAGPALARRYLAVYGAATPQDVAHFLGARVGAARSWLASLADDTEPVSCAGRTELVALREDVDALAATPPRSLTAWPVRLLPLWESMLMAHADKGWTVPDDSERTRVWRKAAMVAAVVMARGRVVATWKQAKRSRSVSVEVTPLGGWRERVHAAGVRREAQALAEHLGYQEGRVAIRD